METAGRPASKSQFLPGWCQSRDITATVSDVGKALQYQHQWRQCGHCQQQQAEISYTQDFINLELGYTY